MEKALKEQEEKAPNWEEALKEQEEKAPNWEEALKEQEEKAPNWEEAFKEEQEAKSKTVDKREIEFLLDIPLEVSVELGRTKMLINDLLQLGQGSVIELDKLAGDPVEILVNQRLVARGEVVVVNEKFGIRLTDILSPMERIRKLKG